MNQTFSIETFLQLAKDQEKDIQNDLMSHKATVPISFDDYVRLLKVRSEKTFLERGVPHQFVIDKDNEDMIRELYLYLICSPKGKLKPHIGILMMGGFGSGKTVLMKAHCEVSSMITRKIITYIHAEALVELIKKNGDTPYLKKPLLIDELGREKVETKNFGDSLKPITDLIALRYDSGARTYATTNFNLETHQERYGEFIRVRMAEMMNIVVLNGKSRRLSNEIKK